MVDAPPFRVTVGRVLLQFRVNFPAHRLKLDIAKHDDFLKTAGHGSHAMPETNYLTMDSHHVAESPVVDHGNQSA